jgi:O-antigen/teichoic acid export membrane protein
VTEKHVIARNTLANAGVRVLQSASAFVYMPFLIASFGLANYGIYMLAGSLSVYLGLLDFGVNPTVVKRVAEHDAHGEREDLGRLVSNAAAYYLAIGVAAAALLWLFSVYGIGLFRLDGADAQLAALLFRVAAVVALVSWPLSLGGAVLNGLQRYHLTAAVNAGVVIGVLAVTAAIIVTGNGPLMLLALTGLVTAAGGVLTCLLAARHLRAVRVSLALINRPGLRAIFGFSWMVFVLQLAQVISDQQTDRFVLATFVGAAAVGLYEPAARLNSLVAQLAALPASALVPAASQLDARARPDALRGLYLRATRYTIILVAPIAATLMVVARPLLLTWLGAEIAEVATPARVLLITWLVYANLAIAFPILIGTGRVRFLMLFNLGTALLNLALSLLLVGPFGILGVIVGTVAADSLLFPLGMWYALRALDISPAYYLKRVAVPAYLPLIVPVGLALTGMALGTTATLAGVAVTGAVAVAAYWLLAYRVSIPPAEREDLRALLRGLVRRDA